MVSIVIPVYNEQEGILAFHMRLMEAIKHIPVKEIFYVDDGSTDETSRILESIQTDVIKVIKHKQNQGHQQALITGCDRASGSFIVTLDGDGQDPPEEIVRLLERQRQTKASVVWTKRLDRQGERLFKLATAKLFYRLVPYGEGDFRLFSKAAWKECRGLIQAHPYLRGALTKASGKHVVVGYNREPRLAGTTHYTFKKMCGLALEGIKFRWKRGLSMHPLFQTLSAILKNENGTSTIIPILATACMVITVFLLPNNIRRFLLASPYTFISAVSVGILFFGFLSFFLLYFFDRFNSNR